MRHVCLILAFVSCITLAENAEPHESITVTAYRTPQALQSAGSSLSVINRDVMTMRQDRVIADALRSTPGTAFARSGPIGAQTQLRLRGAEGNQVLVLIDGVEANDIATNDEFSFEHLTTYDIERVEVVRGPQSALWGSDALAGVVNVVTRRAKQPLESDAFLESGAKGYLDGGGRLGVANERASLSFSGSHMETDGVNASRGGSEDDGYESTTFNAVADALVLPFLRLDVTARHTDATTDFDGEGSVDGEQVPVDADNSTDADQGYLRTGARAGFFDDRWTHELHYAITDTSTDTRSEISPGLYEDRSVYGDKYGLYYQTSLRMTDRHQLTLAASNEREEFRQSGAVQSFDFDNDQVPDLVLDPNQDESMYSTGIAAEYLAEVSEEIVLSGSVRHDDYNDFEDVTTWRGTASWRLLRTGVRFHASVGTGQKTPTFVDRFGFFPDLFIGNPDLEPEKSTGWDLGVEQSWFDGRMLTDLTYFSADLDDQINGFDCSQGPLCTASNEEGTSHRRGVEASADIGLAENYTLSANYTYTDATQPGSQDSDEREIRRPLHTGSVNLARTLFHDRLKLNLGASYYGERKDVVVLDTFETRRATLDSYMLVRLGASYALTRKVDVYGRINNALDADYEDVYGYNTPGAEAFIGLRLSM